MLGPYSESYVFACVYICMCVPAVYLQVNIYSGSARHRSSHYPEV